MGLRDRLIYVALIWLAVYPGVLGIVYLLQWVGLGGALWLRILVSTAITVPLISVLVLPRIEKAVAAVNHESVAELKVDQARAAADDGTTICVERER